MRKMWDEFVETVNMWADWCIERAVSWDSDEEVGCYVGTVLAMEATKNDNPRASDFLNHGQVAEWKEDIEDWLFAGNREFLERLRRARAQDLAGDVRPLDDVEKDLRTRS